VWSTTLTRHYDASPGDTPGPDAQRVVAPVSVMPTLHLIDGAAYLFRAFHALPPLSNADGEPTGALFGVVNMLRRWVQEEKPEHFAFVFDAPGETFRDVLYPAYKANRPPAPADLKAQVQPLLDLVAALGFPVLIIPGVEADDVIGTLAKQAKARGWPVVISTGDKDLTQLVEDGVLWVNTMSGERLDAAGVTAKFGVPPERIVDYLALKGDAVDNIPGVEGVGEKTAAKWLQAYGSLEGVIAHADEIKGRIGERLRAAIPQLPLYRQLATVKCDVELGVQLEDLKPVAPDRERLIPLYRRYGFNQALRELGETVAPSGGARGGRASSSASNSLTPPAPPAEVIHETVQTEAQLSAWIERLKAAPIFAVDLETTSLRALQADIVGIALADAPGRAAYIPVAHRTNEVQLDRAAVLAALKPILEDADRPKVLQHGKYDRHVFQRHGITLEGQTHDTMLESYVLDSTAVLHNLDDMAQKFLGLKTIRYEDVAGKGARQIGFDEVPIDRASAYAAEDADLTLRLHHTLWPRLAAQAAPKQVYETLEVPLIGVLQRMEARGIAIDAAELKQQSQSLAAEMHRLTGEVHAAAGQPFSLDSPKQLGQILYDVLGLPVKAKTASGAPSTNEEALEQLAELHPLPALLLQYRGLAKLKSTYTDKLPQQLLPSTGRLHTSFHQAVAATGRLSSSDPNLQNIPIRTPEGRRVRRAFIAPPGFVLLAADYSQIELRIMAHLSQDPGLLRAFEQGLDVHTATAAEVFGVAVDAVHRDQRRAAKVINFGLIYGMGAVALAKNLDISRSEAAAYIKRYFERYPGVNAYMQQTKQRAREQGYVETVAGRRLYLPDIASRSGGLVAAAERAAINAPMQGTAADIIKRAMIDLDAWLGEDPDCRMLLQVHDELVFEVRADRLEHYRAGIVERMQRAATLSVPLLVESGSGANWDAAH
jgi:DNA polymerase-1